MQEHGLRESLLLEAEYKIVMLNHIKIRRKKNKFFLCKFNDFLRLEFKASIVLDACVASL